MRLDRLYISRYRNLHSFSIDFDESQSTTVLMGRNGSGKSNLIEAIVEIFRELDADEAPPFAYVLEYSCRDHSIKIDADPARASRRLEITIDGEATTQTAFREHRDAYLPTNVFAYYSGWSSRLERHFAEPTRKHYSGVLKSADRKMPMRRLFFCRKEYSQLVLLAFFLAKGPAARLLLENYLGIKDLDSALFVLNRPWWRGTGAPSTVQRAEGDSRFWYARGAFKGFLDRLWRNCLAPIRNAEAVDRDVRHLPEATERLYVFIKDGEQLTKLKEDGESSKVLFNYLESLFLCDLIDEVRVTVKRADNTKVKFTEMSEGEQQLLTVLGLLLFTQEDESLYLLDEPDTHLNPVWTYDFLKLLQDNIRADRGQLIVATHNPLMIGSLRKNQVRLLSQHEGGTLATEPEYDPMGIGVEGLLKSELYGLRSTLAPEVLKKLDRHYGLLGKDVRSEAESKELTSLAEELNELGVGRTHPNPYFEQFANAMARRRPAVGDALTTEELETQTKLADEILAEVLKEEESPAGGREP